MLPSAALRQEGLSAIGNSATYIESARKGLQVKVVREYVCTVILFFIFFTSNFCYAIFHVKRYVPATNAPAMILQQHYNLRHVLVVKHRYSM